MNFPRQYALPGNLTIAPEETIYSVAEYIALLNVTLKPLRATIQGEIGRIKFSQKAIYFSIYDKDRSVINCLVWLSRLQSLGIELKEGLAVKIQGYPDVYSQTGLLTFKADVIIPLGEGALKLAFEKLKKELEAQGYFRQDRKQRLPTYIERIGLITSENGVVSKDFQKGLGNHGLKVYFYDARVEGLQAIEDIVGAIQWFNEHTHNVQVLVIARGGGSLERLQPFNTLEIAKAIYGSKIPVMTAIGHETDVTIADMVADVRASVPMDAGQRIADEWIKAAERIETIDGAILSRFKQACRELEGTLTMYQDTMLSCITKYLSQCNKHVDAYQENLTRCFRDVLKKVKSIEENFNYNYERLANRLTQSKAALAAGERDLCDETTRFIATMDTRLDEYEKVLLACDPQLKLKQGFSIVTDKAGNIIKSSKS